MRFETVVSVVMVLVALGAVWWFRPTPAEPLAPPDLVTTSTAAADIVVHVSGAVSRPGLVQLSEGARVADAIRAAGGTTPEAELGAVNLAALVGDGQHVVVPVESAAGTPVATDGRVHLNSATLEDLQRLPGVGPVLAQRILDHRTTVGRFATPEDLLDVAGIGEATLQRLREHLIVP